MSRDEQLNLLKNFISKCTTSPKSISNYTEFKRVNECIQLVLGKKDVSILDFDDADEFEKLVKDLNNLTQYKNYNNSGNNQYSATVNCYQRFLNAKNLFSKIDKDINCEEIKDSSPLQCILYGAPGTGKSFSIKSEIAKHQGIGVEKVDMEADNIFRTTFHPDYDYAQFVGCYKPTKDGDGKITYEFTPQVFTNALVKAYEKPDESVYLVIEEINRGNCAQIFGDIFQLLDRNANGESEYAINVDEDLRKYLQDYFSGSEKIDKEYKRLIDDGKIKLPRNFNIIATMNTSDQSLFPMDSAFKRRWEWEYVPIKYQNKDDSGAVVTYWIDGKYNWNIVQKIINLKILDITKSEDKQLGDYFIKGVKNNKGLYVIDTDKFINKVMFYLWNDICKDNYNTDDNFFRKETKDKEGEYEEFSFGQLAADDSILDSFILYLKVLAEENKKEWEHLLKDGEINNLEKTNCN